VCGGMEAGVGRWGWGLGREVGEEGGRSGRGWYTQVGEQENKSFMDVNFAKPDCSCWPEVH